MSADSIIQATIMSPGYGKKIYKPKKNRLFLIFGIVFLIGAIFYFVLPPRKTRPDSSVVRKSEREFSQNQNFQTDPSNINGNEKSGDWKDSEKNLSVRESLPDPGPIDRAMLSEANQFFNHRDYKKALEKYKKISGNGRRILIQLGLCYYYLEDYENALFHLQGALAVRGDDWVALKYLAFTHYKMDNLENSLKLTERALEIKYLRDLEIFRDRLIREIEAMKWYSDRQTPHFKIIFNRIEHGDIRHAVLDILEDAFRVIGRQMDYYPERIITVILYNDEAFFDITLVPSWVGGLYDGKIRIPVKGIEGKEGMLKKVLFHEYTHALIHDITPFCPLWINEGLAEYFSTENKPEVVSVFPLNQLEKRFPSQNSRDIALAYLESFSAVSHLISKFDLYRLKDLLNELGRRENIKTAFESVFNISYEDFVQNWGSQ